MFYALQHASGRALPCLAVAAFCAGSLSAEITGLGVVDFETSCTEEAHAAFVDGLTLLHHMMYVQAEEQFARAAEADPNCAMAQWGIGMANFHPLWPGVPSEAETERGMSAVAAASDIEVSTAREQAYLDAMVAFYEAAGDGYRAQLAAWSEAQQAVFEAFPDDIDAGAFAALAQLTMAPRDANFAAQRAAGSILETLHERAPNHPGVYHYAIHAYDHPPLAEMGVPFARGYDAMAPDVPHALHMPSHIFVRLGLWDETAEWNRRSAEAALAQPMPGGVVSGHYAHAIDYSAYAALQMGEAERAEALVADLLGQEKLQDNFGSAYALSASPARLALEQGDWARAAELPLVPHEGIDWSRYPQAQANIWLGRGIGAAKSGDLAGARAAEAALTGIVEALDARGGGYWATLGGAQAQTVSALIAFAEGDTDRAVSGLQEAADIEDAVGKSPVTPGHVLPARELLGEVLTELGRTDEARRAFEATLVESPNRLRSLSALAAINGG